jgi:hypothetical protein
MLVRANPDAVRKVDIYGKLPLHLAAMHRDGIFEDQCQLILKAYKGGAQMWDKVKLLPRHCALKSGGSGNARMLENIPHKIDISNPVTESEAKELQELVRSFVSDETSISSFSPKTIVSYASAKRPRIDEDGGPGLVVAAAVIKALYEDHLLCFSRILVQPGDNWSEEYKKRLCSKYVKAEAMLVLYSGAFLNPTHAWMKWCGRWKER